VMGYALPPESGEPFRAARSRKEDPTRHFRLFTCGHQRLRMSITCLI